MLSGFDAFATAFSSLQLSGERLAGALTEHPEWLWSIFGFCFGIEVALGLLELLASDGGLEGILEKTIKTIIKFVFVGGAISNWAIVSSGVIGGANELTRNLTGIDGKHLEMEALRRAASIIETAQKISVFDPVVDPDAGKGAAK